MIYLKHCSTRAPTNENTDTPSLARVVLAESFTCGLSTRRVESFKAAAIEIAVGRIGELQDVDQGL